MAINWHNIRSFKGSQNKGFEQLCFQLAMIKHKNEGPFVEIEDSGGGDGIEFYQSRDNGKEWGWQAKFYDGSPRLSFSGRRKKIIISLKKAIQEHPNLEKFILCTNSRFTTTEQKWFDNILTKQIPRNRKVVLEHWSEGKILAMLDGVEYVGIKYAFFGEIQLTTEWFRNKFDKVSNLVEKKYNHKLHTKDHELYYYYLGPLLINEDFKKRCNGNIANSQDEYDKYIKALTKLNYSTGKNIAWNSRDQYLEVAQQLKNIASNTLHAINQIQLTITPNQLIHAQNIDGETYLQPMRELKEKMHDIYRQNLPRFKEGYTPDKYLGDRELIEFSRDLTEPFSVAERLIQEIYYFFRDLSIPKHHHLNLLGDAGIGKTHICTSLAMEYLDNHFPTIFLPGIKFGDTNPIENQILQLLDISSKFTFDEFLKTLDSLGKIFNLRIPIIIDGLNESTNETGTLNSRWKKDLRGIETQLDKFSNVVFLTTCRRSYEQEIWGK